MLREFGTIHSAIFVVFLWFSKLFIGVSLDGLSKVSRVSKINAINSEAKLVADNFAEQ